MPESAAERWAAAKAAFSAALEQPTGERPAFVATVCGDDDALRADVESLLAAHVPDDDFLSDAARDRLRADHASDVARDHHDVGLASGTRLGAYRVLHEIARGGMGTVYLAERADAEFEQRVAIKLVTRGMDTELVRRRFRRERQILAELQHPNIARLLEGGTTPDGLPYFVMEYIAGKPIDRYCAAHGLTIDARLDLFRDVCAAVHYAHQRLVVHRDIKPGNILVTAEGTVKLLDFGIAKLLGPSDDEHLTAPASAVLTPQYASPEQLAGASVTTLSDVYSLGVVLHRLLTDRDPSASLGAPNDEPPLPSRTVPALRGDVDTIVLGAMRREPERRYTSAQALSDDILRYRRGLPITARADRWSYRARKFVRRNRAAVALGTLALVALVVGAGAFAWQAHVANGHRAVAERRFANTRRLALSLLFDVHDSIASLPGTTRARQMIVTRSLEALDTLALDDAKDPALRRDIAGAYLKIGDVQGLPYHPNLGQTDEALRSYDRAARLLAPMVASDPSDERARRDLATAYMRIGAIRMRAREWTAAAASERRAVALIEAALRRAPHDVTLQAASGDALVYLGDALGAGDDARSLPRIAAARDVYSRAVAVRLAMLRTGRTYPRVRAASAAYARLGYVASWMADATGDTSQYAVALANHSASERLRHELVALEPDALSRRMLADGWMDMAQSEQPLGHLPNALALYDSAGPLFTALARDDASDVEARRDLAYYQENRGALLVAMRRATDAEFEERAAIAALTRLQRDDPASVEEFYHLAHAQEALGDALAMHAPRAAAAAYADALGTLHRWQRAEPTAAQPARLRKEIDARIVRVNGRN